MAVARFTPGAIAALGRSPMLGSKYFIEPFFFWGAALTLVLHRHRGAWSKGLCLAAAAVVGYLTLHTVPSQLYMSVLWLEYHRTLDVAGAGMIMGATDPRFLFELYPEQPVLDYYRPYMLQHHLSFFGDERASWLGRDLRSMFSDAPNSCKGSINTGVPSGLGLVRLEGLVAGRDVEYPREYQIVFTDKTGKIDGLGNTLASERGFVAYADDDWKAAYIVTVSRRACRFA